MWEIFLTDANPGVLYQCPEGSIALLFTVNLFDIHRYLSSGRCIFNRIAQKIHKNLTHLQWITQYLFVPDPEFPLKLQLFLMNHTFHNDIHIVIELLHTPRCLS